jgi:hypothetical protein
LTKRLVVGAAVAAALIGAPTAVAEPIGFTSPSGNSGCILSDTRVHCDIGERDWSPPLRPADCPESSGYGQGLLLHPTGPAPFVCAGDTAMGGAPVLPYGQFQAGAG